MHEQRLLTVSVECYAGHRGEQTPRTLILGDRRIDGGQDGKAHDADPPER